MTDKKKKSKRGLFLMAAGLLLMAAAGVVTYIHGAVEAKAGLRSAEALAALQVEISDNAGEGRDAVENMLSTFSLTETESAAVGSAEYIGILEVPALGLSLPVQSEWSYPKLNATPCRYTGSAVKDNLVIAGHNYPSHFGYFYRLSGGDSVRFTDVQGNIYDYRVVSIETLEKTQVEEMQAGNWDLTLFTCTSGGAARLAVRCRLQ